MALDTKPNLSCCKFEQEITDTLNLSGTTQVYGSMQFKPGGYLKICDGNQALGKVLTSTANGVACWQVPSTGSITGATNGICQYDTQNICLGGTVTSDIDINTTNKAFSFFGDTTRLVMDNAGGNCSVYICGSGATLLLNKCVSAISGFGDELKMCPTRTVFCSATGGGIKYGGDYSGNYTSRSLVDREYVDKKISGATSGGTSNTITGATNGLSICNKNVVLGGALSCNTSIGNATCFLHINVNDLILTGSTFGLLSNGISKASVNTAGNTLQMCAQNSIVGVKIIHNASGGGVGSTAQLEIKCGCSRFTDGSTSSPGIVYNANYSANYTSRSLVDREYVDKKISGATTGITSNGITGATNGLTAIGKNIVLGGTLTPSAIISHNPGATSYFAVGSGNVANYFGGTIDISKATGITNICLNCVWVGAAYGGAYRTGTYTAPTAMTICSSYSAFRGVEYKSCFHDNYTNRSLVDKEYVDKQITGATTGITSNGITGATNGLTAIGKDIVLGGSLLNDTHINVDVGGLIITGGTGFGICAYFDYVCIGDWNGSNYFYQSDSYSDIYHQNSACYSQICNDISSINIMTRNNISDIENIVYLNDNGICIQSQNITGVTNSLLCTYNGCSLIQTYNGGIGNFENDICLDNNGICLKSGDITSSTELVINSTTIRICSGAPSFVGAQYCADYSPYYTCLSIPNAGWVTGQTGGASTDTQIIFNNAGILSGCDYLKYCTSIDALQVNAGSCAAGNSSVAMICSCVYGNCSFAVGYCNEVCSDHSVILGGHNNVIFPTNDCSAIIAGCTNYICGLKSIIIGGSSNTIYPNSDSSIVLGSFNACVSGNTALILGGGNNAILSSYSAILSSINSCIFSNWSAIIGGYSNCLGVGNDNSVLLGGNTISIADNTLACTVIVPNLAIVCPPAGSGGMLCWNSTTCLVEQTTGSSGSTAASGERISKCITQASHGFVVNDIIGWSGGTYNKAIADGTYDGEVIGIVSNCFSSSVFEVTQAGYVSGLTGLVTNTTYFLSDVTSGLMTSVEPTGNTHVSKTIMIATSSSSGWVLPYAGYIITTGSTGGGSSLTGFDINGNGSTTGFTITHGFGTRDVSVQVYENQSPYGTVLVNVLRPTINDVCVTFTTAPSISVNYRVMIQN